MKSSIAAITMVLLIGNTMSFAQQHHRDYLESVPDTEFQIPMVAVRGGAVSMRSYDPAEHNAESEGTMEASVSSFFIGKYELRYGEFRAWSRDLMAPNQRPVRLYDNVSECGFFHGNLDTRPDANERPATGMNQWSAKRYCQWLSMKTGRFYRLPTEAEWEYACRANESERGYFPWGDDESRLSEFAVIGNGGVYDDDPQCARSGTKKPNAWGIYDMLGNVEEWVADAYVRTGWRKQTVDPISWPLGDPDKLAATGFDPVRELFRKKKIHFNDGFGVTKGGSGFFTRPRMPRAFGVSSRFNPHPISSIQSGWPGVPEKLPIWPVGGAVGFRICRPYQVPSRKEQLWHWGLYLNHDGWLDTTIEPTAGPANPDSTTLKTDKGAGLIGPLSGKEQ